MWRAETPAPVSAPINPSSSPTCGGRAPHSAPRGWGPGSTGPPLRRRPAGRAACLPPRGVGAASGRVVVGPREALRPTRVRLRDTNWIGDGTLDAASAEGGIDVFVKVRWTRPPQPACLIRGEAGFEVELAGGEEGVAPG